MQIKPMGVLDILYNNNIMGQLTDTRGVGSSGWFA